ncbi:MAG: DUF1501 domain-containing protein [Pirellulaceae bacterium]
MTNRAEWDRMCGCGERMAGRSRRALFADWAWGAAGLAAGCLAQQENAVGFGALDPTREHSVRSAAKADSVLWIFLSGGYSHLETFDPKPALNRHAGKTFDQTPFENPVESPLHRKRFRSVPADEINVRDVYPTIYPMQVGWRKWGQSGIDVTNWLPNLAGQVDELCIIRNMWTTDNDHAAENQIHTGRHRLDETQPSIGSWIHYGLGSIHEDLPAFVVLGGPTRSDTRASIDSYYLGPEHAGVPLSIDPANPLPFGSRHPSQTLQSQANEYQLIGDLNRLAAVEYPEDERLRARIRAYELAYRMQRAVPEAVDFRTETSATRAMYGLDADATRPAGERLLAARRLIERGVRFVQVFPSAYGVWDSHQKLKENHERLCGTIDQPVAGLIQDMKQRGLLERTVVVFCTEFGRTPGLELRNGGKDGRDHHPNGFSIWLAGAGIRKGVVHGETDELGYHALGEGHYVTDLHATLLHLLGVDFRSLELPSRKRLEIDHGRVIQDILS